MKRRRTGQSALSPFVSLAASLVGLFLIAPIIVIGVQSLSSGRYLQFPPPSYSLRWYEALIVDVSWRDSFLVSLQVASVVALLATVFGTLGALGLDRWPGKHSELWLSYLLAPMIVPLIVTAVGTFLLFSRMNLTETRFGLVLAHVVLAIPLVTLCVLSALQRTDHSLELSARTLGAGPVRAFRTITLPLILPGVLTGAVFAFIASFDELVIAMFVTGTRTVTLPKRMWDGIQYEIDPTVSAVSTLIVGFTSALVLTAVCLSRWLSKNGAGDGQTNRPIAVELTGLTIETKPGVGSK